MAEEKEYTIERTQDTSYLDGAGEVVEGKLVRIRLHDYDEIHTVKVPSLNPDVVEAEVDQLLADRAALEELG